MDLLALATMKNAVKCEIKCDLHESVSHHVFERNLRHVKWHVHLSAVYYFGGWLDGIVCRYCLVVI